MSQVEYSMRGKQGDNRYKVVGGKLRKMSEARGEDFHPSRHAAIFHGMQAVRRWQFRPMDITFDIYEREAPTDGVTKSP